MGTEWEVTTERLIDSAAIIEEKTAKYNEAWAKLYAELETLKGSKWKGTANDTFNQRLEGYRATFEEMGKVITGYVEFLRNASSNYVKTEEALADSASTLNAGN